MLTVYSFYHSQKSRCSLAAQKIRLTLLCPRRMTRRDVHFFSWRFIVNIIPLLRTVGVTLAAIASMSYLGASLQQVGIVERVSTKVVFVSERGDDPYICIKVNDDLGCSGVSLEKRNATKIGDIVTVSYVRVGENKIRILAPPE